MANPPSLILKITVCYDIRCLNQTIREGGFAMINMGDDTKISDVIHSSIAT